MRLDAAIAYRSKAKTKVEAENAWREGKDFCALSAPLGWVGGPYFSIRNESLIQKIGIDEIAVDTEEGELKITL